LRNVPVGIAMLYLVGIAMILVGEIIEVDVDGIAVKLGDGHAEPIGACHHLQGSDALIVGLVALCHNWQGQKKPC